jgi:hypothetical protein
MKPPLETMLREALPHQDFAVLDRFDQTEAKHRRRNAECEVVLLRLLGEVRLREGALRDRLIALSALDGPQLMHAAASYGTGTISQVAGELFKLRAGIEMVHVPYEDARSCPGCVPANGSRRRIAELQMPT